MSGTAVFSADIRYRYQLTRDLVGQLVDGGGTVTWIMLNPSTADALHDDPTIRRVIDFSRRWGHSRLVVVNLFALRATDPHDVWTHPEPVGADNDDTLRETLKVTDRAVAAWGAALPARWAYRTMIITDLAKCAGVDLWCLGTTRAGHPRHPLYLRADTQLEPWTQPEGDRMTPLSADRHPTPGRKESLDKQRPGW